MSKLTLPLLLLLCGCTTLHITQTDVSNETEKTRTIETKVSGTTLFTGAQALSKLNALQTDQRQGVGVGALNQLQPTNDTLSLLIRLVEAWKK